MNKSNTIAVIGLGYVGLPLAFEFSKFFNVIGFDINKKRIKELNNGKDFTGELSNTTLKNLEASKPEGMQHFQISRLENLRKYTIFKSRGSKTYGNRHKSTRSET